MSEGWDPNISLEEARELCRNLPRMVASKIRKLNEVMGEPSVAGGTHRLGVSATGKIEVQRKENGGVWVRDMGDKPKGP